MAATPYTDVWADARTDYKRERELWKKADANRWLVAHKEYNLTNRSERLKLADAIERKEDTVDNLRYAYNLFRILVQNEWSKGKTSEPIRNLRRRFPYTRWSTVYRQWADHEFSMDEAREWLEDFDGGNDALNLEIENKHGSPEWERRANWLYRETRKLSTDVGTPAPLARAAKYYMKVFDTTFPKVTK